jgi:hypothetical protein
VEQRRQARPLLVLSVVVGTHLAVVWVLTSFSQRLVKTQSGSLQLVWIPRPARPMTVPERETTTQRPKGGPPSHRADHTPAVRSIAAPPVEENNAIQPDWTHELQIEAKNSLANELAKKRHEFDFAHAYPAAPKKPPQFAWNYAATHRVESLPQGGMLIHLGNYCVLLLLPLPMIGCAIGKPSATGDLFEHMHN